MPRKAIDYSKSCIYQFEYKGVVYYIGSTTNFTNRKNNHKTNCNCLTTGSSHLPIYQFIRDNEGWDAWKMVLIEYYNCKDGNELTAREQYWFNIHKPNLLNVVNPSRCRTQYIIDNIVRITEQRKTYKKENEEHIKAYQKIYDKQRKIKLKEEKKIYQEEHKQEILAEKERKKEIQKQKSKLYKAEYYQRKKQEHLKRIYPVV